MSQVKPMSQKDINNTNALVNAYYIFQEASDMMLREAEEIYNRNGVGLQHAVKMRHNRFMQQAKAVHSLNESLMQDYGRAYKDKFVRNTDELRRIASYMARLMMLIADRCGNEDTVRATEDRIYRYIQKLPKQGYISNELIRNLKIKL